MPVLHVIVPHYNEPATLKPCLERVLAAPLPDGWTMRVQLVDDGSAPEAAAQAEDLARGLRASGQPVEFAAHPRNRGKGAAVRTGFDRALDHATEADVVIIQDADLEYDPNDYAAIVAPIIAGDADAVLGTRWGRHRPLRGVIARVHAFGNGALTWLSNRMTGYRVRDMECCYKAFRSDVLRQVTPMLSEERFGIEPQIMAALSRLDARVREVPVAYDPRGFSSGKKIGWRDGVHAIRVILRERGSGRSAARTPERAS